MTHRPRGAMHLAGELTAETNGVRTTLSGSGSLVRWDLVDAERVLSGRHRVARPQLRHLAERLDALGVTLVVGEGEATLVEVGAVSSWWGRLVFGTPAVHPRSLLRLARLALATR